MMSQRFRAIGLLCALGLSLNLAGCSNGGGGLRSLGSKLFGNGAARIAPAEDTLPENATAGTPPPAHRLWDQPVQKRGFLGIGRTKSNADAPVNSYLWKAALDVLNFLPVQSSNPQTGVIVTGFGRPPGGGRAYRATILIEGAALDAASLHVALSTHGGRASAITTRAVEDAILARARQLRIADN